jgi:hypothetical protein
MRLPYYAALFQGKGFFVNCKVDEIKENNEPHIGFVEKVWLKFNDLEWEIDLASKKIKYNSDECLNFFYERIFACNDEAHKKYEFEISSFAKFKFMSFNRTTDFVFGIDFFKKYGDFQNCYGALISEKHLRYLSHLKEIIS